MDKKKKKKEKAQVFFIKSISDLRQVDGIPTPIKHVMCSP
jgi:hypothetical protein